MNSLSIPKIHYEFTVSYLLRLWIHYLFANSLWLHYHISNLTMKILSRNNYEFTLFSTKFTLNSLCFSRIHYEFIIISRIHSKLAIYFAIQFTIHFLFTFHCLSISRSDDELTICLANLLWTHNLIFDIAMNSLSNYLFNYEFTFFSRNNYEFTISSIHQQWVFYAFANSLWIWSWIHYQFSDLTMNLLSILRFDYEFTFACECFIDSFSVPEITMNSPSISRFHYELTVFLTK